MVSFKYANRGTAAYQMELLASSVFAHALRSEREDALVPRKDFDEALEEISAASFGAYNKFIADPDLVTYFQAASPLEEISLLNIGSRPARRFGAKSLADLRAIPWVFAWAQNRHVDHGLVWRRLRPQGVHRRARRSRVSNFCAGCSRIRACSG